MSHFTLEELVQGINTRPTPHNIKTTLAELRRRGYNAVYDGYLEKWVLVG